MGLGLGDQRSNAFTDQVHSAISGPVIARMAGARPWKNASTPMTYEVGGRQFVVIMAGGHHFMETPIGDALVAYALPE